jgi:hypothetical protein
VGSRISFEPVSCILERFRCKQDSISGLAEVLCAGYMLEA